MSEPGITGEVWDGFFQAPGRGSEARLELRRKAVRRRGRTLLLLPCAPALAARSLELYPAQTRIARLARGVLRLTLRLGLAAGTQAMERTVDPRDPFLAFLRRVAQRPQEAPPPEWAMLAGNANTTGRRCVFVVYDTDSQPKWLVKAGAGPEAIGLIQREAEFLLATGGRGGEIPRVHCEFRTDQVAAFAMDYFAGSSPQGEPAESIGRVLGSWVHPGAKCRVGALPSWHRLKQACDPGTFKRLEPLEAAEVQPVIWHGDFAPWNIKEHHGKWTVLDWERGEREGMPGWDWMHYVVQRAVLVEKLTGETLLRKAVSLLENAAFRNYARETGIAGREQAVLEAYLEYVVRIIRPSEGGAALAALLEQLRAAPAALSSRATPAAAGK